MDQKVPEEKNEAIKKADVFCEVFEDQFELRGVVGASEWPGHKTPRSSWTGIEI